MHQIRKVSNVYILQSDIIDMICKRLSYQLIKENKHLLTGKMQILNSLVPALKEYQ